MVDCADTDDTFAGYVKGPRRAHWYPDRSHTPHVGQQGGTSHHFTRAAHECGEQLELLRCQLHFAVGASQFAGLSVEPQVTNRQPIRHGMTSQHGRDPGAQHGCGHGFVHEVVRTCHQPIHDRIVVAVAGEHENGGVGYGLPQ